MFKPWMTSAWTGSCVVHLRRIEGPAIAARLRHDQVDVLGVGMVQRGGTPQA
jgi:hypothetical protein